jgi:nicotinamide mononucleotide transporter
MLRYLKPLATSTHFNKDLFQWIAVSGALTLSWWGASLYFFPDLAPIPIEAIGTFFSLLCVALVVKENLWCWPTGILGVSFLGWAFFTYGLYSTALLHLVYFLPIQFHGWWAWMQGENDTRPVTKLSNVNRIIVSVVAILIPAVAWSLVIGDISLFLGQSAPLFPFWDALILWMSISAQFLMNLKKLESWILWILIDIIAIPLYALSGMWMVSVLYGIFLVLATKGLLDWVNSEKGSRL